MRRTSQASGSRQLPDSSTSSVPERRMRAAWLTFLLSERRELQRSLRDQRARATIAATLRGIDVKVETIDEKVCARRRGRVVFSDQSREERHVLVQRCLPMLRLQVDGGTNDAKSRGRIAERVKVALEHAFMAGGILNHELESHARARRTGSAIAKVWI